MKTIEDFISHECRLNIGLSGLVPSARLLNFRSEAGVQVYSDRGIQHLLMLLQAQLVEDEDQKQMILREANEKYPYPVSHTPMPEIEVFIRKNSIHIIRKTDVLLVVRAKSNIAPLISDPPGQYQMKLEVESIDQAFKLFLSGEVKPQQTS